MKKVQTHKLIAMICAAAFLIQGSMDAYASTRPGHLMATADIGGTVDVTGRDMTVNAGKNRDLFSKMKNLMPGAQVSNTVKITNNSSDAVTFYLKAYSDYVSDGDGAVRADGASAESVMVDGKEFKDQLLGEIDMTIQMGDAILYQGPAAGEGELVTGDYGISLGSVAAKSAETLTVQITLPGESMTNEYASSFGAIDWIFIAEGTSTGGTSGGSEGGSGGNTGGGPGGPGTVIETIEDTEVPLAGMFPGGDDVLILIEDEGVPLANLAKTGGAMLYLQQVSIILVLLIIGLVLVDRKRRHRTKRA